MVKVPKSKELLVLFVSPRGKDHLAEGDLVLGDGRTKTGWP